MSQSIELCPRPSLRTWVSLAGAASAAGLAWWAWKSRRTRKVKVSALYVYPIKSCRGHSVAKAFVNKWGLENDRIGPWSWGLSHCPSNLLKLHNLKGKNRLSFHIISIGYPRFTGFSQRCIAPTFQDLHGCGWKEWNGHTTSAATHGSDTSSLSTREERAWCDSICRCPLFLVKGFLKFKLHKGFEEETNGLVRHSCRFMGHQIQLSSKILGVL